MAAIAKLANVLVCQEVAILPAMWCMAGGASLDARCGMFEYEWPVLCGVALIAGGAGIKVQMRIFGSSMRIMAGAATHTALP